MTTRETLAEQIRQVDRDLDELGIQMATGEIRENDGARLRQTYLEERRRLELEIATSPEAPEKPARSGRRLIAGGVFVVVSIAVAIGAAGQFVQDRQDGPTLGLADQDFNLDNVTNEQMAAVIDAYADDPAVADQLPRMRFRLAERYFVDGDFQKAFEQYDAVIRSDPDPDIAAVSLTRVAWMVWLQQQDPGLPLELVDQALALLPDHPETLYVKAQIIWCGMDDPATAADLLRQVAASDGLPPEVQTQVGDDLAAIESGTPC